MSLVSPAHADPKICCAGPLQCSVSPSLPFSYYGEYFVHVFCKYSAGDRNNDAILRCGIVLISAVPLAVPLTCQSEY